MNLHRIKERRWRGSLALLFGIGLILLAVPWHSQASADFSYNVAATYQVTSDANTRVEEVYTVSNNSGNRYLQSIQLSTPVDDAKNLSVEYADGTSIPFTTTKKTSDQSGYSYDYIEVSINFPRRTVGQNSTWGFVVSYDTAKLVETKGSAHTVTIPAVPQDGSDKYSIELLVPESFGGIHTTGVKPTSQGVKNGQQRYSFKNKEALKKTALLVFGDSTIYQVNFNFPLKNSSSFASTFTVTLPPTTSGQQIIVQKLDPQPKSTRLDQDGNILADYEVPPKTTVTVKTDVIGIVTYLDYNLAASGTSADIPKELVSKYTSAQKYWPADNPQIVAKAKELTKDKTTVAEQVRAINNFVVDHLSYNSEKIKYNIRQGGLKTLQNPTNSVCLEYSDLTISLLRAVDIPARMPIGYGYSGSLKQSNSVTDSLHSWVQAYVPGVGWMNIDPTWNEKFSNFGSSDLDHMAFAIWGASDNSPAPVMQNSQDTNYQYENTTIEYKATPPSLQPDGKLNAQKWLLLPFVALTKINIQAPSSTAGDNYLVRTRQGTQVGTLDLGSLAPQQKISKFVPVFGATAFGVLNADFTQTNGNSLILASTKVNTQTWPMWLVILLIAGIVVGLVVKSKTRKKHHKHLEKDFDEFNTKPVLTLTKTPTEKEEDDDKPAKK